MLKGIRKFFRSELPRILAGSSIFALALIFDTLKVAVLPTILYVLTLILVGFPVFAAAVRGIMRRDFLDEKLLMCAASIGAAVIGEMTEGVAVMLFFLIGEYFEHRATKAARSSIRSLMEIRPDTARVLRAEGECIEDAEDVEVGETIVIRPGERVPLDSVVTDGVAELDTSALTGEAVPLPVGVGDKIDSGAIVIGAMLTAKTLRIASESRASRILELVEEASERKSREESFITSFSRYYTPIVMVLALLMALLPPLFGILEWRDSIYRALSFLVVSCPCALVISVPMAFFGGIGGGARRGVLYKGGNVFSAISRPHSVIFDKTGTLTTGELDLVSVHSVLMSEEDFIRMLASAEYNSNHPVARGICRAFPDAPPADSLIEMPGRGVVAEICGRTVAVGNLSLMDHLGVRSVDRAAYATVHAAIDGEYAGYAVLRDSIKPEAKDALLALRALGVKKTYILSGDRRSAVEAVADALGIDEARAELMPEDKYSALEQIMAKDGRGTVYVGDGINDSPCLARADVGIAMGDRGADSAIESSDVVIMSDKLDRIVTSVACARRTVRIAKQNIVFAIGVKALVLLLVALNVVGMWAAVFADVGVAVLAILNSMRTLAAPSR